MKDASSRARKATQAAISSALPSRPTRNAGDDLLQHVVGNGADHLGVGIAGRHGIDRDALVGRLQRQGLGEADGARLGGGIVGLTHLALLAIDGCDVDYTAISALAHAVDDLAARHVEQAGEVDEDHLVPLLRRHLVQHGVAGDAGVVDQHVDRPELGLNLGHSPLAVLELADVALDDHDAELLGGGLGGRLVIGVAGRDLEAVRLQPGDDGVANAARPAGDHRHSRHVSVPL